MEYRALGRTGVKVSELCLGAMMFGGRTQPEDACAIIDAALDRGINFIDTANVYNQGRSEEVVGEALKRRGAATASFSRPRCTAAWTTKTPTHAATSAATSSSNARLRCGGCRPTGSTSTSCTGPQSDIPIDETLRAMDDLIRDGKVRYIGTSIFAAWQLVESFNVSERLGLNRFICEQPPYNLLDRRIERELLPMAQTYGLAVIPWSPLGGGLLTGKYRRGEAMPEDGRFTLSAEQFQRGLLTERLWDVIDGLEPIAAEKGVHAVAAGAGVVAPAARRHQPDHRAAHDGAVRGQHGRPRRRADGGRPAPHRRHRAARRLRLALLRAATGGRTLTGSDVPTLEWICFARREMIPFLAGPAFSARR